ncbi:MAG: peptidoglycan recognition family protein [Actinomycetota bacterium]
MGLPQRVRSPWRRRFSRRQVLGMGAAAVATAALPAVALDPAPAAAAPGQALGALRPDIRPRSDWADESRPPSDGIEPEDDVRFLLVHHTASTNDYGRDDVVDQIRGFYDFHTGPEKGWPDVAYNFFIDRFGGIWEARAGSIEAAVRGDATGGSQGFALLCSLIGNHAEVPVTAEQQRSLSQLLAWLAERHGIDTAPGATTSFVSRGSNRWAEGVEVTARTISGHREMSTTSCPGDFAFDLLDTVIPTEVSALRAAVATTTTVTSTTTTATATAETSAPTTNSSTASSPTPSSTDQGADADGTATPPAEQAVGVSEADDDGDGGVSSTGLLTIGAVLGAVAAAGGVITRVFTRGQPDV